MVAPDEHARALGDALLALRRARVRLEQLERDRLEPIAIVGLGCRFPGADGPGAFWRLLHSGHDAITEVPPERWDVAAYYDADPDAPGKMSTRWGGFLSGIDGFDPQFFGISPREAASMDPQQRLLLEVSWEALEHAGVAPDRLAGSPTGVFVGVSISDYAHLFTKTGKLEAADAYLSTGNALNVCAGRISYLLGLHGPALVVDTACSSSLVSVHLACRSLRTRESDLALAGGVNLVLLPEINVMLSKARMLAPDGRCKSFDRAADGYVRSDGCGMVLLKRLSDALAEGDRILALIRNTAVNQDGRSSGLTAPNGRAQEALIRKALAEARIPPAEVGFVEAHGSGTPLGDPIEMQALAAALGRDRPASRPLVVGTVKSNIGHLESAAGVAGLIKAVLALQHEEIPPNLHFLDPNPHIPWAELPVVIPVEPRPWPRGEHPRIAGVSSFGFSGTNAHVVLEEAPLPSPPAGLERPAHVLCLSAKTEAALQELARRCGAYLREDPQVRLADVAHTTNAGRAHFAHRAAVIGTTTSDVDDKLQALAEGRPAAGLVTGTVEPGFAPRIAFLFSGQGSQFVGMGRELWDTQPVFRRAIEECDQVARPLLDRPLLSVLYPGAGEASPIDETAYTQPALFALEYALAQLWRSWGVVPAAVLGHSLGEYVAACIAGVFDLQGALGLVVERGRRMQSLPRGGAMAAVTADEPTVRDVMAAHADLSIAALNGPEATVISGAESSLTAVIQELGRQGIRAERLRVSHAFHSPLMEPILDGFEACAATVPTTPPRVHLVSNVTGLTHEPGVAPDARYWRRHLRAPVRFHQGLLSLRALGCTVFVEIGPAPVLLGMARRDLPECEAHWLPSLRKGRSDWEQILDTAARLYSVGAPVDWVGFDRGYAHRRVALPTYPFQRQRCWLESRAPNRGPEIAAETEPAYAVEWKPSDGVRATTLEAPRRWLILADRGGVGGGLARLLRDRGDACTLLADQDAAGRFRQLMAEAPPYTHVVHLWSLDASLPAHTSPSSLHADEQRICGSALALLQAVLEAKPPRLPKTWYVTRGAQALANDREPPALAAASLWGLGRVVALEHPETWGGLVDLPPEATSHDALDLLNEMEDSSGEDSVGFRDGRRFVARLVPVPLPPAPDRLIDAEGAYLITGGLGGLGLEVAQGLVAAGARHLILVGRSLPSEAVRARIAEMEGRGSRILTAQCDVASAGEVAALVEEIGARALPLRGVVHAAGVLDDGALARQDWGRFESVLAPKVQGAWNLHAATRHIPLDFFVLFSSTASLFGSPGQGNYAAANAFLDGLARYRRALGLRALSINWGAWARVGMAAALGGRDHQAWASRGLTLLEPERAVDTLLRVLRTDAAQAAVARVAWPTFAQSFPSERLPSLARELAGRAGSRADGGDPSVLRKFLDGPPEQRPAVIEDYLRRQLGRALGLKDPDVRPSSNLLEMGIDSLMVMEVINSCRRDLGLRLYPREFYERPSFGALVSYLTQELLTARGLAGGGTPPPAAPSAEPAAAPASRPSSLTRPTNPRAVFLLSSPRAGSTLARVMLAGHPQLFCPPELHLLPFDTMAHRERGLGGTYLGEGLQRAVMELQGLDAEGGREATDTWLREDADVQTVYAWLQEAAQPRLLVDKSPSYGGSMDTLRRAERLFDQALYLFLIRHPYAVIESFVRNRMNKIVGGEEEDPHLRGEQVWSRMNGNIMEFLAGVDPRRQLLVRFEDLMANAEAVGRRITDFLGIPWDPAIASPYEGARMTDGVRPGSLGIGDPNFLDHQAIDPSLGEVWRTIRLPRLLGSEARRVAVAAGYELPAEDEAAGTMALAPSTAMRESFVEVRGLRLCLCTWGPENGPLVVCLHGIMDHGAAWEDVAQALAAQGHRVVAVDQRGHGRSSHAQGTGSYRLLDFAADLDALLDGRTRPPVVLPGERVILVGHSMGAAVAGLFARLRPERVAGLVLVESALPGAVRKGELAERLRGQLSHLGAPPSHAVLPGAAAAAGRLTASVPSLSPERALRFAERLTEPCEGGVRWRWDPWLLTRSDVSADSLTLGPDAYLELLRGIEAPTALVHCPGSADVLDRLKTVLPVATTSVVAGGHHLHLDAPRAVAQVIAQVGAPVEAMP